jgi:tetratricopeptide (TPR) repeat protein
LKQVSDRLAEQGERIPPSTLARVENASLDPGIRRLHLLLAVYDIPPRVVADLVELEMLGDAARPDVDLETLYREGLESWREGNLVKGLAYLAAVRRHEPTDDSGRLLRQRASLAFAIQARDLGRYRLAKEILDELLCDSSCTDLKVNVLVTMASVWRSLGSPDSAMAYLRQAETYVKTADSREAGWVSHLKAKLLAAAGEGEEANAEILRALGVYRALDDRYGEAKALLSGIAIGEARAGAETALSLAGGVVEFCVKNGLRQLAVMASLEVGRLLSKLGRHVEAAETLKQALAESVVIEDRKLQFIAHQHLWKVYEASGEARRARFEMDAAKHFGAYVDKTSVESDDLQVPWNP